MKSQPLLLITLIISHLLVNVVWASTHKGVDWQDDDNMPHLHYFSLHSDHADDEADSHHTHASEPENPLMTEASADDHEHHHHAHICLVFQVPNLFSMASDQIQNARPVTPGWPSSTSSLQPPVPPPLA